MTISVRASEALDKWNTSVVPSSPRPVTISARASEALDPVPHGVVVLDPMAMIYARVNVTLDQHSCGAPIPARNCDDLCDGERSYRLSNRPDYLCEGE